MSQYRIYFNPHCAGCEPAIEAMRQAVLALGQEPQILNVLDDLDTAARLRITRVPALVRDEAVLSQGPVDPDVLQKLLTAA